MMSTQKPGDPVEREPAGRSGINWAWWAMMVMVVAVALTVGIFAGIWLNEKISRIADERICAVVVEDSIKPGLCP